MSNGWYEALEKENRVLLELIPEWRDEARRLRESQWVTAYLLGCGLGYDEIMRIRDARHIVMAYKALKYSLIGSAAFTRWN